MSQRPLRIALLMHSLNPRGGVVHTLELADAGPAMLMQAAQALLQPVQPAEAVQDQARPPGLAA